MKLGKQQKENNNYDEIRNKRNKKQVKREKQECLIGIGAKTITTTDDITKKKDMSGIITVVLLTVLGILVGYLSSSLLIDILTKNLLELNV